MTIQERDYDPALMQGAENSTNMQAITSAAAAAFAVGPNGSTNPALQVDASTGSMAAGLKVTGATAAGTVAAAVISSGSNASLSVDAKGSGTIAIGTVSTGAVTIGAAAGATAIDASAATLKFKRNVLASSGNTTMTVGMSGSVMLLDGAATDFTLPAISAADIGMEFWFVATIIATDQTITAGAADLLTGSIEIVDTAADTDVFVPDVSDDLIITLNGTTTGGKTVGSWCHLVAISATRWWVEGIFLTATETQSTPFS